MCGICGTLGFNSPELVDRMNRQMLHRGPDDIGVWHEGEVSLGHTRLSIIDSSCRGHQPMSNENGEIWATFNGEIYNFQALRLDLESKGHAFKSNTDAEVIVHLYEEYEERCLDYLRGMFSFAIWDKNRRKLFIARDRFGIKPLFYFFNDDKFIFASELKAILATGRIKKDINLNAAIGYFSYGSVQAPDTMIKDIFQLLPGHYIVFEGSRLRIEKYWALDFLNGSKSEESEAQYISEIRAILEEAVKMRMISDVPIGAFLSGGIDSSVIAALMQKHSPRPVKTFSVIFEEEAYDEREFSNRVAKIFGTQHTQILLKEDDILREIPAIFEAMDQPSIDGFNTFIISKAVKEAGLTVALSGLGADELFAGYASFKTLPKLAYAVKFTKCIPEGIKNDLFYFLRQLARTRRSLKLFFSLLKCKNLNELYLLQRMVFLPNEVNEILDIPKRKVEQEIFCNGHMITDAVNALSFLELTKYLQNTLLQDTDRMSMANSLEVRVPFLDHLLVEKMFEIPGKIKVGSRLPKRLLVKSMQDILPKEIYDRPKMGFVFPFEKWLRGKLKGYCEARLSHENLKRIPFLNEDKVREIWAYFLNGSKLYNSSSVLAMLSFANWYEKNVLKCEMS